MQGLVLFYNNAIHNFSGYAPAFLMFGCNLRTPIDMLIGAVCPAVTATTTEWVENRHRQLGYAYSKSTAHLNKTAEKN